MLKRFVISMVFIAGLAVSAMAVEKKPLPDFQLTSAQGHAFSSLQLAGRSRWLMLIVSPSDPLCDKLLRTLKTWPESSWLAKTTILIEAPAVEAQTYVSQELPDQWQRLSWASDEPKNATLVLHLQGLPVILGMDQSQMQWTISGILNDPNTLQSIVQSWLK